MGKIITIASLKGGVGKTAVSASLAHALARLGFRTLAVDMDFGVRGLDIALGQENSAACNCLDVILGNVSLEESALQDGRSDKLFFLSAPASRCDIDLSDKIAQFLKSAKQEFDYVILDTATGSGAILDAVSGSGEVDTFLVMCTQNAASVRAAEGLGADLYRTGEEDIRLIINSFIHEGSTELMGITEIIGLASITLMGVIPYDTRLEGLLSSGKTMLEDDKSISGKAVENIAARITGENVALLDGVIPKWRKIKLY